MSAETELYAVLAAAAGLTALVSTRIYPDAIPEDSALPAVVYSRASTDPVLSVSGQKFAETARFQITAWDKTRTSSAAVADQVRGHLRQPHAQGRRPGAGRAHRRMAAGHQPQQRIRWRDGFIRHDARQRLVHCFLTARQATPEHPPFRRVFFWRLKNGKCS
mgnify:CR=1 FL=1